jgi:hypothetical protein
MAGVLLVRLEKITSLQFLMLSEMVTSVNTENHCRIKTDPFSSRIICLKITLNHGMELGKIRPNGILTIHFNPQPQQIRHFPLSRLAMGISTYSILLFLQDFIAARFLGECP